MDDKDKRPKYEPPIAKDLSDHLALGDSGASCAKGGLPSSPGCNPGSAPAACVSGATP